MKILVTGGAGFIGSHLTDALLASGHEVTVLDNLSSGNKDFISPEAEWIQDDIRSPGIEKIFQSHHFDIVFHEAAQTLVPASIANPPADADENIMGLLNILECCRRTHVGKVVFSSSAAVYGDNNALPLHEKESPDPTSFYGLTKWMTERYLALYSRLFHLSYTVLRYSNVYGPRQGSHGEGGVIYIFAKALASQKPMVIFGDGTQTRDFISVHDVVSANLAALNHGDGATVNICTQKETSLSDLTSMMSRITGSSQPVVKSAPREGDIYRSCLSCEKAASLLHWHPSVSLQDGLQETCDYFMQKHQ